MASWSPEENIVGQLATILSQAASPSRAARDQAKIAMEEASSHPDINNYLVYLLVTKEAQVPTNIRATAGLVLKNTLRNSIDRLGYVKEEIVKGLVDPDHMIRNVASIVVTSVLSLVKIGGWPEILGQLLQLIESSSVDAQEGAIYALARICEDSAAELDTDHTGRGDRPTNTLIPTLITVCSSQSPKIRGQAIFCLIQFIPFQSQAFLAHIDEFMQALFTLANDPDSKIRSNIARAFKALFEVRADKIIPHMDGVVSFCLHCIKDDDDEVALEGAEFILTMADSPLEPELVRHHLPNIIPVILSTMVYSDMDIMLLDSLDEDNENVADRAEDIKPVHIKQKEGHQAKSKRGGDEDDEDDEDNEDPEDILSTWNLRKCSAAALDTFAGKYATLVLQIAQPHLLERVNSSEWQIRESGVLAFGAIAQGCQVQGEAMFVPELVPFLIKMLSDEHAPIREMACWTLSRYVEPVCESQELFNPVFHGVLACSLDRNKKVQEAGCNALSVIAEYAGSMLLPYAKPLCYHFQQCFQKYQLRSMLTLYECIQSVVIAISPAMTDPEILEILMAPIVSRWQTHDDTDIELLPLLSCIAAVAANARESFAPYASVVFERSAKIVHQIFVMEERFKQDPVNCEAPELDFAVCGIDVVDGLVQGLQSKVVALLNTCQNPSFMELVMASLQCDMMEVRQSGYALIGDMAIYCVDELRPHLAKLVPEAISQIEVSEQIADAVCNNSMWALGELSLQVGRDLVPYFTDLFQRLGTVLMNQSAAYTLMENAAITIGRMGISMSAEIAPHLGIFIENWLMVMTDVEETNEKDTAFQGLCIVIGSNPGALSGQEQLGRLLRSFAYYYTPSPDLKKLISEVINGYRAHVPNFDEVLKLLGQDIVYQLQSEYGI